MEAAPTPHPLPSGIVPASERVMLKAFNTSLLPAWEGVGVSPEGFGRPPLPHRLREPPPQPCLPAPPQRPWPENQQILEIRILKAHSGPGHSRLIPQAPSILPAPPAGPVSSVSETAPICPWPPISMATALALALILSYWPMAMASVWYLTPILAAFCPFSTC